LTVKGERALLEPEELSASARALGVQLFSERYRERLAEAMGVDLSGALLEAWFWRYDFATQFVPYRGDETMIVLQPILRQAPTSRNTVTVHFHRG
jgi:hypothetical protein